MSAGAQMTPLASWEGLAADALLAPIQSPQGPTVEGVSQRYGLAMKVHVGGSQDITPAEAAMIQEAVAESFPPLVAGPVILLLNGK